MKHDEITRYFEEVAVAHIPYLSQWYMDIPVVVSSMRYKELQRIQQLLYRAICHFANHYSEYEDTFPVEGKMKQIITLCNHYPYRPGTYRPDFLIDKQGNLKICEIGARFPLNGYFLSGMAEYIGIHKFPYPPFNPQKEYEHFLSYLFEYWGSFTSLCVLKGSDRPCDIKYYIPFFEKAGINVTVLTPEEISSHTEALKDAAVINEFNQMELLALPLETLTAIASTNALNDMRSIFLIHDKRFLSVLCNDNFLGACMPKEDAAFLRKYLIPTYTRQQSPEKWADAYSHPDDWLVKPFLLGKSENIYAGSLCSEQEWKQLFDSPAIETMVLQPYIRQKRIPGSIGRQVYNDYVVGTLLCFDNRFFGTGLFRTSSYEITNRVDDRKMAPCFTDDLTIHPEIFIL